MKPWPALGRSATGQYFNIYSFSQFESEALKATSFIWSVTLLLRAGE
jgi:hypothetical protein